MASLKSLFTDAVGKLVFRACTITAATTLTANFRRLELTGDSLRGPAYNPGDKLQVLLPGVGPRTYTPFAHAADRGTVDLLVHHHGDEPGARWGQSAAVGDSVRVFGPRSSIPLVSFAGSIVLVGDETSFALARALLDHRGSSDNVHTLFEVTTPEESTRVLATLRVPNPTLVPRGDDHLATLAGHVRTALESSPGADLVLTGNARTIQSLRAALKQPPTLSNRQKVKAYWSPGKRGLD